MNKWILGLFLGLNCIFCNAQSGSDFTVTISLGNSSTQSRTQNAPSGNHSSAEEANAQLQASVQRTVESLNVYDLSITQAEALIKNELRQTFNLDAKVSYNYTLDKNSEFRKEVVKNKQDFDRQLYKNVSRPTFSSSFLKKDISFDRNNEGDRAALQSYRQAINNQSEQLGANQSFYSSQLSKNVIETRQSLKGVLSPQELNLLGKVAQSINNEDQKSFLESFSELLDVPEFARGFSASVLNHLNPLSSLYPLDPDCQNSSSCQLGSTLGDASSLIIGIYEIFQGATITSLGIGSGFGVVLATPVTAGVSLYLVPTAAIPMAVAGIATAGHGLSVVTSSIESLHKKADSEVNQQQIQKSAKGLEEISKIKVKTEIGEAVQELSVNALKLRLQVERGSKLYRIGTRGRSMTGKEAQFWSLEDPRTLGYANRYGLPSENINKPDFIEIAYLKENGNFVTRRAEGIGANKGGGIEVVVEQGHVSIESHISLDK